LPSYTEIISFKNFCNQHRLALKPWLLFSFVISSAFTGTFHVILHNLTAASHSNMKKMFLLLLKILPFAYRKPAGDHCFVKLSGHHAVPLLFCLS
jgi:hypothetical protein